MHVPSSVFYRRTLPHIVRYDRPLFITWSTYKRWILPPGARTIALRHLLFEHLLRIWVDVAVIMPDHVHMILSLLETRQFDDRVLSRIMKSIKGISARNINLLLKRRGPVWRDESFDHVVRKTETSRAKFEYVCNNPVRAGLVASADDYLWLWRSWIEGAQTGVSAPQDFD